MKKSNAVLIICLLITAGCQPPQQPPPMWEQVKVRDLAPAKHSTRVKSATETTLQFNVYILSVPADRIDDTKDIWTSLSTKQIRFNNAHSFGQNGFVTGFGPNDRWEPIAAKLDAAKAKTQKTVNLMIFDGGSDRVLLLQANNEKNIFYTSEGDQVNGVTLGPGEAAIRLAAATVPDVRGVCNLTITPVFKNNPKPDAVSAGTDEIAFNAVSFTARMAAGDFVLVGPAGYSPHDLTLGNIFFALPAQSTVQFYLIACVGVNN